MKTSKWLGITMTKSDKLLALFLSVASIAAIGGSVYASTRTQPIRIHALFNPRSGPGDLNHHISYPRERHPTSAPRNPRHKMSAPKERRPISGPSKGHFQSYEK